MNILVTGGAGFIGGELVLRLSKEGHHVVVVDSFDPYYSRKVKDSHVALFPSSVTLYEINSANVKALENVFKTHTFDVVCHLAAQAGVRTSLEKPFENIEANYIGTLAVLECMRKYKVPQLLFASTSSVYGSREKVPFVETDEVNEQVSIYATTKRAAELLAYTYHALYGINVTAFRFFTVFGQFGRPDMAPYLFTNAMLDGTPITVFNHGKMERDFTHVDDIVQGFICALDKPLGFSIINLGRGEPTQLLDFIHIIEEATGNPAKIEYAPMQPGDVPRTFADITKARASIGFTPKVSLKEGLIQYVTWLKANRHLYL